MTAVAAVFCLKRMQCYKQWTAVGWQSGLLQQLLDSWYREEQKPGIFAVSAEPCILGVPAVILKDGKSARHKTFFLQTLTGTCLIECMSHKHKDAQSGTCKRILNFEAKSNRHVSLHCFRSLSRREEPFWIVAISLSSFFFLPNLYYSIFRQEMNSFGTNLCNKSLCGNNLTARESLPKCDICFLIIICLQFSFWCNIGWKK